MNNLIEEDEEESAKTFQKDISNLLNDLLANFENKADESSIIKAKPIEEKNEEPEANHVLVKDDKDEEIDEEAEDEAEAEEENKIFEYDSDLCDEIDDFICNLDKGEVDLNNNRWYMATHMKCDACKCKKSLYWRRVAREKYVCNNCFFTKAYLILFDDEHLEAASRNKKKRNISELNYDSNTDDSSSNESDEEDAEDSEETSSSNSQFDLESQIDLKKMNRNKVNMIKSALPSRPITRTILNSKKDETIKSTNKLSQTSSETLQENNSSTALRKSARFTNKNNRNPSDDTVPQTETTGSSRRTKIFKKDTPAPIKFETRVSKIETSDYVFHRGFYMQVGDIVALLDVDDKENVYFAQIRAFLSDQYGLKSAVITWLVPISTDYKGIRQAKDFDPSLFALGPSEELPRSLDCMEFVCRLTDVNFQSIDASYNYSNQFKNDLLRHKFALQDIYQSDVTYVTTKQIAYNQSTNDIRVVREPETRVVETIQKDIQF